MIFSLVILIWVTINNMEVGLAWISFKRVGAANISSCLVQLYKYTRYLFGLFCRKVILVFTAKQVHWSIQSICLLLLIKRKSGFWFGEDEEVRNLEKLWQFCQELQPKFPWELSSCTCKKKKKQRKEERERDVSNGQHKPHYYTSMHVFLLTCDIFFKSSQKRRLNEDHELARKEDALRDMENDFAADTKHDPVPDVDEIYEEIAVRLNKLCPYRYRWYGLCQK